MKKISFLAVAVLVAIFVVQCADQLLSQPEKPEYYSKSLYGSKLQELEYRVRDLGWMQSGVVTLFETHYVINLEKSYKDDNYAILLQRRGLHPNGSLYAITLTVKSITTNSFEIIAIPVGNLPVDVSWLTIGK